MKFLFWCLIFSCHEGFIYCILSCTSTLLFILQETRGQWQIVFYIAAGVYVTGALIFIFFARGVEQPWNKPNGQGLSFRNKSGSIPYGAVEEDNRRKVVSVNN